MTTAYRAVPGFAITLLLMARVASAQALPVHTFQDLQLKPSQRVQVRTDDGKNVSGRLVSVVGDQLEISRTRWLVRQERRVFTESTVERIKIQDSTWNGAVVGAGAGVLGAVLLTAVCETFACLGPAILSIGMGPAVGVSIDGMINRTIFTSAAGRGAGLSIAPLLTPGRVGVTLQMRLR